MRIYRNKCDSCSNLSSNSSLGAFFALLKIFRISQTSSLVSILKIFKNTKLPPQILELFIKNTLNSHSLAEGARARGWVKSPSLRGESTDSPKQSTIKSNPCVSTTESRPLRGAKNRIQGCRSATADFLLEAEKRGSPPKSEKAAAFWRVGGAGRGVQPFLRKEISESNGKNDKKLANSPLRHCDSYNFASSDLDSSLRTSCFAQNDEINTNLHKSTTKDTL